ncbi:MAG: diguanylate cyclase, partial [Oscillibacter sp.]
LKKIFENKYSCLEAGDGEEAIAVLKENPGEVDLILLDIVMPNMDGKEFLRYKKDTPELDSIPVIMITADDSPEQQIHTLSLGANDYIVKPFIPEVVIRRVRNVLQYNRRFKEIIKEYNTMSQQVKTDLMTGLYNRGSAETLITQRLENGTGLHAMLMLDVDNFKKLNDTYGHAYGDRAIRAIAKKLRSLFRENDVVTRMGGDEFSVFMENVPSVEAVERKAQELCQKMSAIQVKGEGAAITCSVGVTIGEGGEDTFETLYKKADKALYNAKCRGKNMLSIYDKELSQATPNWIHDAETVLNELSDVIYICKKDSYEMLYMNDYACRFFGVTREHCVGKNCYEVLMREKTPCAFCPVARLSPERVFGGLFRFPHSSRVFLMRGKEMNWNGITAHLEVAVEMADIENLKTFLLEEAASDGTQ